MILISAFLKIPFDHPLCTWDRIVIGSIVYTSCNILGCTKILFSSQCTPRYGVCYTLLECCPPSATALWILTFFPAFLINKLCDFQRNLVLTWILPSFVDVLWDFTMTVVSFKFCSELLATGCVEQISGHMC